MKRLNARGVIDPFLIPLVLTTVLLLAAGSFAIWAYMSRQDYKTNVDEKIAAAVEIAKQETVTAKDNEFVEKEKLPLKDYAGPPAFGGLVIKYPKTWSAYVDERSGSIPVNGYLHPTFVPGTQTQNISYALRFEILDTTYSQELRQFDSNIKAGRIKATPYIPAKVQSVTGMRLDGEIAPNKKGSLVILPMRDKTLKIWSEGDQFIQDFNNNILPNYSFEP